MFGWDRPASEVGTLEFAGIAAVGIDIVVELGDKRYYMRRGEIVCKMMSVVGSVGIAVVLSGVVFAQGVAV
jgi:hypothetical protein